MNPILARSGHLTPYLAAWIPLTAILAGLLVLAAGLTWLEAAALAVPLAGVYAFVCLSSWYLCRVFPPSAARLGALAGTFTVAAAAAAAVWVLWAGTVATFLGAFQPFASLPERLPRIGPAVFLLGVLVYLLAAALHYVLLAFESAQAEARRAAEMQALARDAELAALKQQLNPHFLFNSLNSISSLTGSNPGKAREMCVLLAGFLRATLGLSEKTSIPLSEELALVRSYLAIEEVRFGDRLAVQEDIDPRAAGCAVPPLLLQPLVENAGKHGVAPRLEGGVVRVRATRTDGTLVIALTNPVDAGAAPAAGAGLGLRNVRRRLAARWGTDATLREEVREGTFSVALSIPAESKA
ncbi:MAG TPA: histidine kinase [Thermoanaerobaculia bacterium]|nr:histidine kinase [Thermoanaerobaculia bacterium]